MAQVIEEKDLGFFPPYPKGRPVCEDHGLPMYFLGKGVFVCPDERGVEGEKAMISGEGEP